ncbi:MAG: enoyl-CoA hydratase/isomerase family protein [Deltaproteobacteria bacterium]|nr:enoyl-CoA hydratase/isomerase family protein [Deltaproteobacteria bacterium]
MTSTNSSTTTTASKKSGEGAPVTGQQHGAGEALTLKVVDNIAVITIDVPGEKQNTLSEKTKHGFKVCFERVANDPAIEGAVLISGKPDFIAGADISMIQTRKSASEVERLSREMQQQLALLEQSKKPIVAAISGACMGGGLEIALACHYRIATDHPKTALSLPEVMLGLLPGGGGTQRLPALIGIQAALDMMLTGKNVRARKAKRMGLVDAVTVPYGLEDAAVTTCKRLIKGEISHQEPKKKLPERATEAALEDNPAGRAILFRQARQMVMEKTGGLYPAPLAIIDVVEAGASKGLETGYAEESRRFGELVMSKEAAALMTLFFAQTALKKNRFGKAATQLNTLGVLGAGLMGSGIAEVTVQKGVRVLLKDMNAEALARGQKGIWGDFDKRVRSHAMTPFERDRTFSSVVPKTDYKGFEKCELVIEAVFEDLALKHKIIRELEDHVRTDCVIASNTSALPITKLAEASKRPQNIIGMHYFSPVPKMPLLEIIVHKGTSKEAKALAVDVGIKQGKTVIVVNDGPGFYTSRILGPLMDEAAQCALEGVDLHEIDHAMRQWGFPVGPITLLDEVGIDVAAHVSKDMAPFFEPRFGPRDRSALEAMVKEGFTGRKGGKGFYLYDRTKQSPVEKARAIVEKAMGASRKDKPYNPGALAILERHGVKHGSKKDVDLRELQERIGLRMVNEAVQCLQEGILENAVDGDAGAVFGLGFPPMTGGPFRYVDSVGASTVVSTLERFATKYGKRFKPAELLVDHAKSGKRFHVKG